MTGFKGLKARRKFEKRSMIVSDNLESMDADSPPVCGCDMYHHVLYPYFLPFPSYGERVCFISILYRLHTI